MSNSLPDTETPVNLRVSKALNLQTGQAQSQGDVVAGQVAPPTAVSTVPTETARSFEERMGSAPAFAAGAAVLLLGTGWLVHRRQRLAQAPRRDAGPAATGPAPSTAPDEAVDASAPGEDRVRGDSRPMADILADLASQFEDGPQQPQQTSPAPLGTQYRAKSRVAVGNQKRLIKSLMWVRTAAGATAIVAAIALVVFWSIEMIDRRSGDTGLTQPLLVVALAAWAASWGAGLLANQLHRLFFGRVHPKFDT